MSWSALQDLYETKPSQNNPEFKKQFKATGTKALKEVKAALERTGRVKHVVHYYAKGGPAVSGDLHLKGDFVSGGSFDMFFNFDGFCSYITYRKTRNQMDHVGDLNRQMTFDMDVEEIVKRIILLNDPKYEAP